MDHRLLLLQVSQIFKNHQKQIRTNVKDVLSSPRVTDYSSRIQTKHSWTCGNSTFLATLLLEYFIQLFLFDYVCCELWCIRLLSVVMYSAVVVRSTRGYTGCLGSSLSSWHRVQTHIWFILTQPEGGRPYVFLLLDQASLK